MKIYGQGNATLVEITKLIDDIFNQTMQVGHVADETYIEDVLFQSNQELPELDEKRKALLNKTADSLKETIGLYIDLKLEMCSRIIEIL